jgi:penicillin-binding protein 1A
MKQIFGRLFLFIFRLLKTIFVQPFRWYFALSFKKKVIVGISTFIISGFLLLSVPVLLFYSVASGLLGKMPTDNELLAIKNYQASEVYSADSVLLGRYFVQNRSDVSYEKVSPYLLNAIIATEDARFYEHKGVDSRSLLRVLFKSILMGKKKGGGSTISQQLAKNLFGRKQYGFLTMPVNKIREAIIANQLEKLYNKKEIIMLYVNTVSFGEDTYGIKTSSQRFFNIAPDQLQAEQAAVLAGMLKSPSIYNPRRNPGKSLERRNVVLQQMEKAHYLTTVESNRLQAKPLLLKYNRLDNSEGLAPYFREKLRTEIEQWLAAHPKADGSLYSLYTDGLKIYTTIHSRLQRYAEEAATEHLGKIQPLLQRELKARAFFKKNAPLVTNNIKKSARYQALKETALSEEEILKELQKPDSMVVFSLGEEKESYLSPIDSVKLVLSTLQIGFLVVDPHNGEVLVWVGGADFRQTQYDHIMAQRQAGSVFKPIVYAKALQTGIQPCDFIANQKITYTEYENWAPENSGEEYEGRYSVAGALANSVNTISVQLCMGAGIQNVIDLARLMGIQSDLPVKPSIALGTADMSLWELTGAYTAFANDGRKPDLHFINSISNEKGIILYESKPVVVQVLDKTLAQNMTNMLRNVVDKGTAHDLRTKYNFKSPIAGKTGTTQEHRDGWFMGYTSKMLAGVWVGADNPAVHFTTMSQGRGAAMAMPVWAGFYQRVLRDPSLRSMLTTPFPFENDLDCEMHKEDNFFQKIFRRKNKTSRSTGLEENKRERKKNRKEKKKK